MRLFILLGLFLLALSGCVSRAYPTLNNNYANEQWRSQVDTDPDVWLKGADAWFLSGDPKVSLVKDKHVAETEAISTMQVKASDFSNIQIAGSFQVQIFGTHGEPNSLYIYGPNADVRKISVQMRGNLLCIDQADPKVNLKNVIVRIGVGELSRLTHEGSGTVEGLMLNSTGLVIESKASGDTYLSGNMNLKRLNLNGVGTVTVLGANTPVLDVTMRGLGTVNIGGNVGLRSLDHEGMGDFNLIGANSDGMNVMAKGGGKLGFYGNFNIKNVEVRGHACVLMMTSQSQSAYVYVYDQAKVGISGWTHDLTVYTSDSAKFWGRYLQADNVYARASDDSHINVTGRVRVFAAATNTASVYFYGEPSVLTQFVSGYGTVIPMWNSGSQYKDSYKDRPMPGVTNSTPVYPHYKPNAKYRWRNGHLEQVTA